MNVAVSAERMATITRAEFIKEQVDLLGDSPESAAEIWDALTMTPDELRAAGYPPGLLLLNKLTVGHWCGGQGLVCGGCLAVATVGGVAGGLPPAEGVGGNRRSRLEPRGILPPPKTTTKLDPTVIAGLTGNLTVRVLLHCDLRRSSWPSYRPFPFPSPA